jgi:hypothetical protein
MSKNYTTDILLILKKRNKDRFVELAKLIYQFGKPGILSIHKLAKKLDDWVKMLEKIKTDPTEIAQMISEKYF